MQPKDSTQNKRRILAAYFLSLSTLYLFLMALPNASKVSLLREGRMAFARVGLQTNWRMFAPNPRRDHPVRLEANYEFAGEQEPQKEVIVDFLREKSGTLFSGFDEMHAKIFYLRLSNPADAKPIIELYVDELKKKKEAQTGKKVKRVSLVWWEVSIPDISETFISPLDAWTLPQLDRPAFEKSYE